MAKLLPALLLAAFLAFVVAGFSTKNALKLTTGADTSAAKERPLIKQYWMVFLKKGIVTEQNEAADSIVQAKHMANIRQLADEGKMVVAGPFGGNDELRGIFIMDCKDSLEVASLLRADAAIATGRLTFEIRPWWTAKNCLFK